MPPNPPRIDWKPVPDTVTAVSPSRAIPRGASPVTWGAAGGGAAPRPRAAHASAAAVKDAPTARSARVAGLFIGKPP